ncbi:dissimilatory sulfite reductase D family protein [Desulfofundulus thermocisternus]|nr:dissimilatory sulfite reductase D family protein [Desulfofundulus thermocisternus]
MESTRCTRAGVNENACPGHFLNIYELERVGLSVEEIKKAIIEFASNSKKTRFYFKDMEKAVQEKIPAAKAREIKKAASELVNEGTLIYFSTGSTTMYGLKERCASDEPQQ